jgi:hypothetical protein
MVGREAFGENSISKMHISSKTNQSTELNRDKREHRERKKRMATINDVQKKKNNAWKGKLLNLVRVFERIKLVVFFSRITLSHKTIKIKI